MKNTRFASLHRNQRHCLGRIDKIGKVLLSNNINRYIHCHIGRQGDNVQGGTGTSTYITLEILYGKVRYRILEGDHAGEES